MTLFNFADAYKAEGLTPGPEIIGRRQEAFENLRARINTQAAICLTRLYFGLDASDGVDWFRGAFIATDPSFSMIENQRESAVLSACLLSAAMEDGIATAGLALLCASVAGTRLPVVHRELLEKARHSLHDQAVGARRHSHSNPALIEAPKGKDPSKVLASQDWATAAALFSDSAAGLTSVTTQVRDVLVPLVAEVVNLREEVEILWWYVGGWSRHLDRPFAHLKPALACAMAGLDLVELTRGTVGPAAAPALLHRLISAAHRKALGKVTIKDAVDAWPESSFALLPIDHRVKSVPDICPVLTAFAKASEIGPGAAWNGPFEKAAKILATTSFSPIDLAMQVYREAMLVALLD